MKQIILLGLGVLLLASGAVSAQPVRSVPYTGTPAGTSADDLLWSQLNDPKSTFTDQAFEAGYAAYTSWGGDDFRVSLFGNSRWEIESLFTPGSMSNPESNPLFVSVAFHEDAGGIPGAEICVYPLNTNFTSDDGDLTIDVSTCKISSSGVRWVSQTVRMDFDPFGQHFWVTRSSANENPAVWKNPGNGFGTGCLDWQPANAACGMAGEDFLFELWGRVGSADEDGVPAIGPFGVVLLIVSLGAGSAYVLRRRRTN